MQAIKEETEDEQSHTPNTPVPPAYNYRQELDNLQAEISPNSYKKKASPQV